MADNLCGPSNALQNFQKHSSVDRTLQQDRLISRQSPSQGFRSSPGLNAGRLDPEFEAFQAGNLPISQVDPQFQHHPFSNAPPTLNQAGPPNWAADFQNLHISSPSPQLQQQPFSPQSQIQQNLGGWHQDFARQQNRALEHPAALSRAQNITSQFAPIHTMPGMSRFAGPTINTFTEQNTAQQQPVESFDEAAFARAFDEAAISELEVAQEVEQVQDTELGQDILINESAEHFMEAEPLVEHRLGADLIHDPSRESNDQQQQDDPDALARTAGQLLDSVSHNTSDKFQNSQFLELMRQLRDKEVVVEGDKIVGSAVDDQLKVAEQ